MFKNISIEIKNVAFTVFMQGGFFMANGGTIELEPIKTIYWLERGDPIERIEKLKFKIRIPIEKIVINEEYGFGDFRIHGEGYIDKRLYCFNIPSCYIRTRKANSDTLLIEGRAYPAGEEKFFIELEEIK